MTFYIAEFEFEGPGLLPTDLNAAPGVFLLLHHTDEDVYEILDFGQFENMNESWNSVNFQHFQSSYPGEVTLAAHYCPRANRQARREIVQAVRKEFDILVAQQQAAVERRALVALCAP